MPGSVAPSAPVHPCDIWDILLNNMCCLWEIHTKRGGIQHCIGRLQPLVCAVQCQRLCKGPVTSSKTLRLVNIYT